MRQAEARGEGQIGPALAREVRVQDARPFLLERLALEGVVAVPVAAEALADLLQAREVFARVDRVEGELVLVLAPLADHDRTPARETAHLAVDPAPGAEQERVDRMPDGGHAGSF